MELKLFVLFLLCCPSQGWPCGDKEVEYDSDYVCDCSGEKITLDDYIDSDKECCPPPGGGHCEVTTEGNVRCNNSRVCYDSFKCGDTRLGGDKTCHCSADLLSRDDYRNDDKRCCQPPGGGDCKVNSEGDVKCYNSTLHNREHQPCNGECYFSDHQLCNGECRTACNCINRAYEVGTMIEDLRNYSSVVPCDNATDWLGYSVAGGGLMCGEECLATAHWCRRWACKICGNFTTTDAKLCQNYNFWNNKDCTLLQWECE